MFGTHTNTLGQGIVPGSIFAMHGIPHMFPYIKRFLATYKTLRRAVQSVAT